MSREGDLRERAAEFLVNELLMDQQHVESLEFSVKRVGGNRPRGASPAGVKDEVLLTFNSRRERDDVRSFAKNLERRGRGVRLEIPDHLWPSFRVLQSIGYELKQKHADLKRNVLFDDAAEDLKLDVLVNSEWKTIYPAGARLSLAKLGRPASSGRSCMAAEEIDSLLTDRMEQ